MLKVSGYFFLLLFPEKMLLKHEVKTREIQAEYSGDDYNPRDLRGRRITKEMAHTMYVHVNKYILKIA
jgi:hypothetical protein